MPKIYVAFHQNGFRVAASSEGGLRKKVSQFKDTVWSTFIYDFKTDVETVLTLVEGDVSKWAATPKPHEHWRINPQGQVRKFDPSKAIVEGQS